MIDGKAITIRKCSETDLPAVYSLIKEFASFQKTPERVSITIEQMKADKDFFKCFVAVHETAGVIGFASCFFTYYSWSGKAIYLDDLYVAESFRGQSIGTKLFDSIIAFGRQENCKKLRWQVSNWNTEAISFYKSKGATVDDVEINCDLDLRMNFQTTKNTAMLTLKKTIKIDAPVSEVWEALTKPELIKQYFFGTNTSSDWKKGSPIVSTGEWEGKTYEDKGTILDIEENKFIRYTYWSSLSGTEDIPSNYANIGYDLSSENGSTELTITQDSIATQEKYDDSEKGWEYVLDSLKKLVEGKA